MKKGLDLNSAKIYIEAGDAIIFIYGLGLDIRISEGTLSPFLNNAWVSAVTIYNKKKVTLAQGLSMSGSDRQMARSLAIFEAVESLYFFSYTNPDFIQNSINQTDEEFENIFGIIKCRLFQTYKNTIIPLGKNKELFCNYTKIKNSVGWAFGSDIESTCSRAANEVIEKEIRNNLNFFSNLFIPIDIKNIEYGYSLEKISEEQGFELKAAVVKMENKLNFSICTLHDPLTNKTFVGTSFGGNEVACTIRKSLEEVWMGFYFSVIANDPLVGTSIDDFNYEIFSNIYSSLGKKKSQKELEDMNISNKTLPLISSLDFSFRLFSVTSPTTSTLFVAQAIANHG